MTAGSFNPLEGAAQYPVLRHLSGACLWTAPRSVFIIPGGRFGKIIHLQLSTDFTLQTASHPCKPAWTPKTPVQLPRPEDLMLASSAVHASRIDPTPQAITVGPSRMQGRSRGSSSQEATGSPAWHHTLCQTQLLAAGGPLASQSTEGNQAAPLQRGIARTGAPQTM